MAAHWRRWRRRAEEVSDGFTLIRRLRPDAVRRPRSDQARDRSGDRRDPIEPVRRRRVCVVASSSCALRQLCDDNGCSSFDEVQTGVGAPATCSPISTPASSSTSWRSPRRWVAASARRPPRQRRAAKGATVGRLTFGGNPLAIAAGNAVLDVVLADGFRPRAARLARARSGWPRSWTAIHGHCRGTREDLGGLAPSCRAPSCRFAARERMITVAPADNVVRPSAADRERGRDCQPSGASNAPAPHCEGTQSRASRSVG